MSSASFMAWRTPSVVPSMSVTTSRRTPLLRAWPTPRILTSGFFGGSPATSAMIAQVFVDPMSNPATRLGLISTVRSLGKRYHHLIPEAHVDAPDPGQFVPRAQVAQRELHLPQPDGAEVRGEQHLRQRRIAEQE